MPYPERTERAAAARSSEYTGRPIHPGDAPMIQRTVRELAEEPLRSPDIAELPPSLLARFTLIDYDRDMALVALPVLPPARTASAHHRNASSAMSLCHQPDPSSCRFALLVSQLRQPGPGRAPDVQHHGRVARERQPKSGAGAGGEP